jgi:hypothetical protein
MKLYVAGGIVLVLFVWLFAFRPAVACWDRGGQPVRGFFDNVECVEAR